NQTRAKARAQHLRRAADAERFLAHREDIEPVPLEKVAESARAPAREMIRRIVQRFDALLPAATIRHAQRHEAMLGKAFAGDIQERLRVFLMFEDFKESHHVKLFHRMRGGNFLRAHRRDIPQPIMLSRKSHRVVIQLDPRYIKPGIARRCKKIPHATSKIEQAPALRSLRIAEEK